MRTILITALAIVALGVVGCGGGGAKKTATPATGACGAPAPATAIASSCGSTTPLALTSVSASAGTLTAASFDGVPQDGMTLGRADAPVQVNLYQNFLCPHCQEFALTMLPTLIRDYVTPGKVAITFHDAALGGGGADIAHEGARCAGAQGKFWPAYAALYQNFAQDETTYTVKYVESALSALSLDNAKLDTCLTSEQFKGDVDTSTAAFQGLLNTMPAYANAAATASAGQGPVIPLVDVGGNVLIAPASYNVVKAAIDAKLATR